MEREDKFDGENANNLANEGFVMCSINCFLVSTILRDISDPGASLSEIV